MLNFNQLVEKTIKIAINKAQSSYLYLFLKALLAGIFVVLGVCVRNAAVYNINNDSLVRILGSLFFPIGFIFIVYLGGELFTGNSLMIMAVLDKKVKLLRMIKNLIIVYIGNLVGSLLGVSLINSSGFLNINKGALGAFTINVACNKLSLNTTELLFSSIICNIFVCGAILMVTATKDASAKFLISWYTICAFGIVGFEHIVVNMYYLPAGLWASHNNDYVSKAIKLYNVVNNDINNINILNIIRSFSIVTLGNTIGGVLLVGIFMYIIKQQSYNYKHKM